MNAPYIFNTQKFSVHDGPGIRTTVFFKGCPLRCLWCHNPESQCYQAEVMTNQDGKTETIGTQYTIPDLVRRLQADQIFYDQSGGGVTFSGGEVMTQNMDYIVALAQALQRVGVSVAIDTCGHAPQTHFEQLLPHADLFLYDLKCISSSLHKELTGVSNELILENLSYLSRRGAAIDLRLILIGGVNTDADSLRQIHSWLKDEGVSVERVTLLPYHDFGRDKYAKLNRSCTQNFSVPENDEVARVQSYFQNAGYHVHIGG